MSDLAFAFISRDERDRAVAALCKEFPKAFHIDPRRRVPLKHGIAGDIKTYLVENKDSELCHFDTDHIVDWYCGHVGYRHACSSPGNARLDLQGRVVAKVTESEARVAAQEADAIFAEIAARKNRWQQQPQSGFIARPIPQERTLAINTDLNNNEMLQAIEKQLGLVQTILGDCSDESLGGQLARPALRLMVDELNTIIARLDQPT